VTGPAAGQAPGIVKIRLSGALADITAAVSALSCPAVGFDLIEVSQPYPNRRDPGARLYLTIRLAADPSARPHLTAEEDS
jgi:hypothetical protein